MLKGYIIATRLPYIGNIYRFKPIRDSYIKVIKRE